MFSTFYFLVICFFFLDSSSDDIMLKDMCNKICKSNDAYRFRAICRLRCSRKTTVPYTSRVPTPTITTTTTISPTLRKLIDVRTTFNTHENTVFGGKPTVVATKYAVKTTTRLNSRYYLNHRSTPAFLNTVKSTDSNQRFFLKLAASILGVCLVLMICLLAFRNTKRHHRVSFSNESEFLNYVNVY